MVDCGRAGVGETSETVYPSDLQHAKSVSRVVESTAVDGGSLGAGVRTGPTAA